MSYLTDRRQFTEANNRRSLLGPRLYTIYVNDLPDHIDSGDLYMYADDTTVYCIGPTVDLVMSSLNKTMEQVLMWSVRNQLTIHPIKTEATTSTLAISTSLTIPLALELKSTIS